MKVITLASYSDGVGWAFLANAAERFATVFLLSVPFSSSEDAQKSLSARERATCVHLPQLFIHTGNRKTKPIAEAGAQ
jgi:hypothetical protein